MPKMTATDQNISSTIANQDAANAVSLTDFSVSRQDPALPCHSLRPFEKNTDFCGRSDVLQQIDECLAPFDKHDVARHGVKSVAICGPGGMGKTQVANEYVSINSDTYQAIFWIQAENPTILAEEYCRIAETLGLISPGSPAVNDQATRFDLVKSWLKNPVKSYNQSTGSSEIVPWLLVFDNVNDLQNLSKYWPDGGKTGSILITSREHLGTSNQIQINSGIQLQPLSNQDASDLLSKLTKSPNNTQEQIHRMEIVEKLGGLPLAVTQIAGVMTRKCLTCADFLKRLEKDQSNSELFSLSNSTAGNSSNYGHTLSTVWAMDDLKYGSGLLDVLAFLEPGGISESLLMKARGQVMLGDYPKTDSEYKDALRELLKSSLVDRSESNSTLTVHRLIQDGARARMSAIRTQEVFSAVVDILWLSWPSEATRHDLSRWKICEGISPHIHRLKERFQTSSELQLRAAKNLRFFTIVNQMGCKYYQERGNTGFALDCYHLAQKNVEMIVLNNENAQFHSYLCQPIENPIVLLAEVHNNLASAATEFNDAETALNHFQIYNKMLLEENSCHKVDDSRLTSSFFNVGLSLTMNGFYDEAETYYNKALEAALQLQEHRKILIARSLALINKGLTKWLSGAFSESSLILENALAEREEVFGANDRVSMITGRALYCLGNVRDSQNLQVQSLAFHERALQHFKDTVGNNHHRTGNSCFKVAEHYVRLGEFDKATELLDQAIKIFEHHQGCNPEKVRAMFLKSVVLKQQSHHVLSKLLLKEAHTLYETFCPLTIPEAELSVPEISKFVHVWGR